MRALVVLVLTVALAGGGAAAQAAAALRVANYAFDPARLVVAPGANVTVTNEDAEPHAMRTVDLATTFAQNVPPHGSASFAAPATSGEYRYYCPFHTSPDASGDFMKGTLVVQPTVPPTPNPTTPTTKPAPVAAWLGVVAVAGAALALRRRE
jgi:plastocyanin